MSLEGGFAGKSDPVETRTRRRGSARLREPIDLSEIGLPAAKSRGIEREQEDGGAPALVRLRTTPPAQAARQELDDQPDRKPLMAGFKPAEGQDRSGQCCRDDGRVARRPTLIVH